MNPDKFEEFLNQMCDNLRRQYIQDPSLSFAWVIPENNKPYINPSHLRQGDKPMSINSIWDDRGEPVPIYRPEKCDYFLNIPVYWIQSNLFPYYAVIHNHDRSAAVGLTQRMEIFSLHHTMYEYQGLSHFLATTAKI